MLDSGAEALVAGLTDDARASRAGTLRGFVRGAVVDYVASAVLASRPTLVRLGASFLIGSNVLFLLQYQVFM